VSGVSEVVDLYTALRLTQTTGVRVFVSRKKT